MILVRMWGGIGNQLFIYLFGLYIRYCYAQEVCYDTNSYHSFSDSRRLDIEEVTGQLPVCNSFSLSTSQGIIGRLRRWMFQLSPKNHFITEDADIPSHYKSGHNYYFQGYWQDYKYYSWLKENIGTFATGLRLLSDELTAYDEDIAHVENSVSLHIRRGDYFTPQYIHTYGVCTKDYYNNAIRRLSAQLDDPRFFLFSDDINWVKENINLPDDAVIIPNLEVNQFCYIQLMSHCKHHIISNSSFSWWGAVLDAQADSVVIAPSRWTLDSDSTPALDTWVKMEV